MENLSFRLKDDLVLENGRVLRRPVISYQIWGSPKTDGSNVVWVCHALTANANVFDWWAGLFGEDDYFNSKDWCIVCANVIGSCYGSAGPLSVNPETGEKYYYNFPSLTIRDMVKAHRLLADHLGFAKIEVLIGGSLGGQQALQWAISEPERFEILIPIATNAVHSPWGIAFNESQRMAIENDASWGELNDHAGLQGMKVARSIALLSYRNYQRYGISQKRDSSDSIGRWRAQSYQIYQGEKLAKRFNANSYHLLSQAMDSHDLAYPDQHLETVLERIQAKTLLISLEGDILFPEEEQRQLARDIPAAKHALVHTTYGHDGFLIETPKLSELIKGFIEEVKESELKKTLKSI